MLLDSHFGCDYPFHPSNTIPGHLQDFKTEHACFWILESLCAEIAGEFHKRLNRIACSRKGSGE